MISIEFLNEAFDTTISYQVDRATNDEFITSAVIGNREIVYGGEENRDGVWQIAFLERKISDSSSGTFSKSGSGNEFSVFSFVIESTKQLISRYRPKEIRFTSEKTDENRTSLYTKLLKKFPIEGYTFVGVNNKGIDDEFIIKRNDNL